MIELKNCPFCGGAVEIKKEKMFGYWIGCPSCIIETSYMNEADAIAAWNARTASPRFTEEEREAIGVVCSKSDEYLYNYRFDSKEGIQFRTAIATVRAILTASEIADKGKG